MVCFLTYSSYYDSIKRSLVERYWAIGSEEKGFFYITQISKWIVNGGFGNCRTSYNRGMRFAPSMFIQIALFGNFAYLPDVVRNPESGLKRCK